jgi:hypothetical protein
MTAAAIVAFLIAIVVKATIWPYATFLALAGISGLAGWAIYREKGDGQEDGAGGELAESPSLVKPGP